MSGLQPFFFVVYLIVPIVVLVLLAVLKPRILPVSALICLAVNGLLFGVELLYPESRGMALSLILVQAAAVLVISMALQYVLSRHTGSK